MGDMNATIWIPRAGENARRLAWQLRAMGRDPLIAPVVSADDVVPQHDAAHYDEGRYDAIVCTSPRALHSPYVQQLLQGESFAHIPVFTVGEKTAEMAARAGAGLCIDVSANMPDAGTGTKALVRYLAEHSTWHGKHFLYLSGEAVSADMAALLAPYAITVERQSVYRMVYQETVPAQVSAHWSQLAGVMLFSQNMTRHIPTCVASAGLSASDLVAFCLSPDIAAVAKELGYKDVVHGDVSGVKQLLLAMKTANVG